VCACGQGVEEGQGYLWVLGARRRTCLCVCIGPQRIPHQSYPTCFYTPPHAARARNHPRNLPTRVSPTLTWSTSFLEGWRGELWCLCVFEACFAWFCGAAKFRVFGVIPPKGWITPQFPTHLSYHAPPQAMGIRLTPQTTHPPAGNPRRGRQTTPDHLSDSNTPPLCGTLGVVRDLSC
jgi:hypothetical protein